MHMRVIGVHLMCVFLLVLFYVVCVACTLYIPNYM